MKPSSYSNGIGSNSPPKPQRSLVLQVEDKFDFENNLSPDGSGDVDQCGKMSKNGQLVNDLTNKLNSPTTTIGASYFSSNFDENGYVFDGVKIDIEDIDNTSVSNMTTQSLKRCKSQVLKHYYRLLCFIGWRPFYKEHYYPIPFFITILNYIYPILIVSLLFYAYTYDIVTCQAKLNIAVDTQSIKTTTSGPPVTVTTTTTDSIDGYDIAQLMSRLSGNSESKKLLSVLNSSKTENERVDDQCGHILTTYILPSLIHLIAYIIGFIYFRINENEQLYALMEKVFLAVNQSLKTVSQDRVIKRLKVFIFLGVIWVIMAMSLNVMSRAAFGLEKPMFQPQWASIILEFIALVILYSVYLAVVINHSTQCEMIIFYVNEIRTRLEEKSVTLKDAMQQILDIRMAIGNLNSTVSKMATLVTLIFIEKFMIGFIILILNRVYSPLAWIYRGSFVISWFLILSFTLVQVARLNNKCGKFKQIALSARVYGYHASSRDELDSFLLFISSARLRAKLLGVSIKPSLILGTLILISFIIIILFQTSIITSPLSIV